MQEKSVRYVLRFWGMDRKGDQVNSLLTFGTLRAARCTAVRVLFELGPRIHFWIALNGGFTQPTSSLQHSVHVLQPGDDYYETRHN